MLSFSILPWNFVEYHIVVGYMVVGNPKYLKGGVEPPHNEQGVGTQKCFPQFIRQRHERLLRRIQLTQQEYISVCTSYVGFHPSCRTCSVYCTWNVFQDASGDKQQFHPPASVELGDCGRFSKLCLSAGAGEKGGNSSHCYYYSSLGPLSTGLMCLEVYSLWVLWTTTFSCNTVYLHAQ